MRVSMMRRHVCLCSFLVALMAVSDAAARRELQTVDELEGAVLSAGQAPVVVMYRSESCSACTRAEPTIEALERTYGSGVVFATVDVQEAMVLARRHGIASLPTFQFFHDAELIQQFSSADSDAIWQWTQYVARLAGVQEIAADEELQDSPAELHNLHAEIEEPESREHNLDVELAGPEPAGPEPNISNPEFLPQPEHHEIQAAEPEVASPPSLCRGRHLNSSLEEVIIIGAGPSGLSAAIYVARAGLCPLILTQSCSLAPQPFSSSLSCDYPAVPDRNGSELVKMMWEQAESFDAELLAGSAVRLEVLATQQSLFAVHTDTHGTILARSVIVASGTTLQHLEVEGEELYQGNGVSWCAQCDASLYTDQPCAVVGGGDDALGDALMLTRHCSSVTLVHDMAEFSARPALREQVASNSKIDVRLGTHVVRFAGAGGHLTHLELRQAENASAAAGHEMLAASVAFVAIGHVPNTDFLTGFAVLDDSGSIKTLERSSRTLVPGIFAAGAVVAGSGALMSAVVAAGSGATAGLDAERFLSEASHTGSEQFAWTILQTLAWAAVPLLFLIWATGPQDAVPAQVNKQLSVFCQPRLKQLN